MLIDQLIAIKIGVHFQKKENLRVELGLSYYPVVTSMTHMIHGGKSTKSGTVEEDAP